MIYLPHPVNPETYTIGESNFIKNNIFWKLHVLCEESWNSNNWTKQGFNVMNGSKKLNLYLNFMKLHDIPYKIIYNRYSITIRVSRRASVIESINHIYNNMYNTTIEYMYNEKYYVRSGYNNDYYCEDDFNTLARLLGTHFDIDNYTQLIR